MFQYAQYSQDFGEGRSIAGGIFLFLGVVFLLFNFSFLLILLPRIQHRPIWKITAILGPSLVILFLIILKFSRPTYIRAWDDTLSLWF